MNNRSQALVIVISFLGMLSLIGVAFFSLSQAQRSSSVHELNRVKSLYLAEAGINYTKRVLELDRQDNRIDSKADIIFKHFQGEEADLNHDGKKESKWFYVLDSEGKTFGRFGIRILDEASKVNVNSVELSTFDRLLSQVGIEGKEASSIYSKRPFSVIEEIGSVLDRDEFNKLEDFITIYSQDSEVDLNRNRRHYLNSLNVQLILEGFLRQGVKDAYQKAAILKDASDADLRQTILDKFHSGSLTPSGISESGGWINRGTYFEAPVGGSFGRFIWSNLGVEDGEYFCFLYGTESSDVVGEIIGVPIFSGEGLIDKVIVSGGSFTLDITPAQDANSKFSYIDLVSTSQKNGLKKQVITGSEGLVINELMVKLIQELTVDLPIIDPGESLAHTFSDIQPGFYYLKVLAKQTGGLVGDVTVKNKTAGDLRDNEYFPYSVEVGQDQELKLMIKNNSYESSGLKGISLSQQPDAEFIEILNITPSEIDLSNFSLEVYTDDDQLVAGWPGIIPEGTRIQAYQHLVLNVDDADTSLSPENLRNNKISFKQSWRFNGIGLNFQDYSDTIDKSFDLIPDGGGKVILKDVYGKRVDAVEYSGSQVPAFKSIERPDPTLKSDQDQDGLFDGWNFSEDKDRATPKLTNENSGMYTREGNRLVKHSPSEITIFNRPLLGLKEVMELPTGESWEEFVISDLARICDAYAYELDSFILDAKLLDSKGDREIIQINNISPGSYWLSITAVDSEAAQFTVSYKKDTQEEFQQPSSLVISDGIADYGKIELDAEEEYNLQLEVINTLGKKLNLNKIILEPVAFEPGRINLNTAEAEVLRSVLNSEHLVLKILENRPLGEALGVGELLLLDTGFLPLYNIFTVKSDIFGIECIGAYISLEKPLSPQTIRSVIRR
ncbi:MAG: lamin tail domain-containing protein [Candidatus Omnitrophota bacterium]